MANVCEEKVRLSQLVSRTIAELYKAKASYDNARETGPDQRAALASTLTAARETARAAERSYREHTETHRC
jgi:hypothetical protein